MSLRAGERLGSYEILALIGQGGMGEVWKARDTRLDRVVAIKRLKGRHGTRFEQEARAIAALNHPHICQIYDIGPDYLVLEYVEGLPLRGPLAAEEAVRLGVQIAGALEAAHKKGILHRDLKPANILVADAGAKLLDFGFAKLMTDSSADATQTIEGTVLGTAAYMSPEQAEGSPLDVRSDVFSFGAVLYEMLSGNRAFGGASMAQTLSAVLRDEPGQLKAPEALVRIVARCLRKAPAERFQTAEEVRSALEKVARFPGPGVDVKPSIGVLPFADMSPGKDNEYFSDGLAEEIINALAQVPGLKVIARTSAFAFKGQNLDVRRVAETLGVTNILEGSVRKAGDRIRVTAQLIAAADGSHLWSQRYDRDLADVFAVQDEIAAAIAQVLKVKLGASPASPRYTPKLEAYEAYLMGQYYISKITLESLARAKQCFEQAAELDPAFASPQVGLGGYFAYRAFYGLSPAHDFMPLARRAAQRALDIDPLLPEAHAVLGQVAALYDYDWTEAERRYKSAMASEPASVQTRFGYGVYLLALGRTGEATAQVVRVVQEDPLHVPRRLTLAICLEVSGQDAAKELLQAAELDENFWLTFGVLANCHAAHGRLAEAFAAAERAYSLAPRIPRNAGFLAGVLARTGDVSRAQAVLSKLGSGEAPGVPIALAVYHLLCGEIDQAANWVEKAIEQREPGILFLLRQPLAQTLRSSQRWPALAKMMNLAEPG